MTSSQISLSEAIEWRVPIWEPAVSFALEQGSTKLPADSKILEIGYNSGKMSCYMAKHYDWNVIGYEILEEQKIKAQENAKKYQVEDNLNFLTCPPEKTFEIEGEFDGIFLKSILYHNKSLEDYIKWIKWLKTKLKPGGVLMAIENGQGTILDRAYRKYNPRVTWGDNQFFNQTIEQEFRKVFPNITINYYGGISQYFTFNNTLFNCAKGMEKILPLKNSKRAFVASIVAVNS